MSITPPRPQGPHLNAMRSFEAAARLGGFAAAAEELCVTPGAVSQQVKALEDWIGAPLFERRTQGVALTTLGAAVRAEFTTAFDTLGGALQNLRAQAPGTPVQIAALPSVAQLWLAPRLAKVRAALPGQIISITAMETPPNLRREVFDLSLFFSDNADADHHIPLARDVIFPVCTPGVAARLATPLDIRREVLIHDATWHDDWRLWCKAAGMAANPSQANVVHSLYAIALDDALSGAGLLMGHSTLLSDHLASGTLVRPFATEFDRGRHLTLAMAHAHAHAHGATAAVAKLLQSAL